MCDDALLRDLTQNDANWHLFHWMNFIRALSLSLSLRMKLTLFVRLCVCLNEGETFFSSKSNQMLAQIESDTHIKHFMKSVTIYSVPFHSIHSWIKCSVWNPLKCFEWHTSERIFYRHLNLFGISLSNEVRQRAGCYYGREKIIEFPFMGKRNHDFPFKWYINFGIARKKCHSELSVAVLYDLRPPYFNE